jgi:aminoglycoside 6'-N-acetyltransferase
VTVRLRPATPGDAELLAYWDTKPHVIAATGDDDSEDWSVYLAIDPGWRWVHIAEEDNRPVGIVQVIDPREEESHYWGDIEPGLRAIDIWIGEEDDLGRGVGTQMMRLTHEICFSDADVAAIVIDPLERNIRARQFYERLGYRAVGPRRFGSDECIVYRLSRADWDKNGSA